MIDIIIKNKLHTRLRITQNKIMQNFSKLILLFPLLISTGLIISGIILSHNSDGSIRFNI